MRLPSATALRSSITHFAELPVDFCTTNWSADARRGSGGPGLRQGCTGLPVPLGDITVIAMDRWSLPRTRRPDPEPSEFLTVLTKSQRSPVLSRIRIELFAIFSR